MPPHTKTEGHKGDLRSQMFISIPQWGRKEQPLPNLMFSGCETFKGLGTISVKQNCGKKPQNNK